MTGRNGTYYHECYLAEFGHVDVDVLRSDLVRSNQRNIKLD